MQSRHSGGLIIIQRIIKSVVARDIEENPMVTSDWKAKMDIFNVLLLVKRQSEEFDYVGRKRCNHSWKRQGPERLVVRWSHVMMSSIKCLDYRWKETWNGNTVGKKENSSMNRALEVMYRLYSQSLVILYFYVFNNHYLLNTTGSKYMLLLKGTSYKHVPRFEACL